MKNIVYILIAMIALVGCQKKPTNSATNSKGQQVSRQLIARSLKDLENKNLKGAVESLEAAIKASPSEPEAYLLMGQILLKVGEYNQAALFLDQAAKVHPNNGTIFYMLSVAHRMLGNKLLAVLSAKRSVEIFQAAEDKDNFLKSAVLLQDLINMPDPASKENATEGNL